MRTLGNQSPIPLVSRTHPPGVVMNELPPEVELPLRRAAELRAGGSSWSATARQMEIDEDELFDLVQNHHHEFRDRLKTARRFVQNDTFAEALHALRKLMRSDDERVVARAADCVMRFRM